MRLRDQLLLVVDPYLTLTDTAESRLSKSMFENGNTFRLMRRGADPGWTIVTDMAPPGLDWNDVRRRARP